MIRGITKTKVDENALRLPKFNASIHNRFDLEVIDSKTGQLKRTVQGFNTICNQLWTRLFTPETYNSYIHYGSGSGTPSSSDTSLFEFKGYGASADYSWSTDYTTGVSWFKTRLQLSETTAVGVKLTEVGLAYGTTASSLCTHAMLQDMNGNPISLEKTDTDIVNIYATVFIHWSFEGYDDKHIRIVGGMRSYTSYSGGTSTNSNIESGFLRYLAGKYRKASGTYGYSTVYPLKYLAATKGFNTSSTIFNNVGLTMTADINTKSLKLTAARLPVATGNSGGIGVLYFGYSTSLSQYDTVLALFPGGSWHPGSDIVGESIGTGNGEKLRFSTDFDFPENGSVYVDGQLQTSGVTIHKRPRQSDLSPYLWAIYPGATADNLIPLFNPTPTKSTSYGKGEYWYYNPTNDIGIASVYVSNAAMTVYGSNDLEMWTPLNSTSGSTTLSGEQQHYKFFKLVNTSSVNYSFYLTPNTYDGCNIEFEVAPPSGAVITADYHTDFIAKDANHVFDVSVTIQIGEYTEAQ